MDTKAKKRRRRFTNEFRCQVVAETLDGAASVSEVARRHDLNTNQVFTWRRRYLNGDLAQPGSATLVPIQVAPSAVDEQALAPQSAGRAADYTGTIEVALAAGHRLSVRGDVDPAVLRQVLESLR